MAMSTAVVVMNLLSRLLLSNRCTDLLQNFCECSLLPLTDLFESRCYPYFCDFFIAISLEFSSIRLEGIHI